MIDFNHPIAKAIVEYLASPQPQREPKRGRKKARASAYRSSEKALARLWEHLRRRGQGGGR
jgi:hypothetical protein